MKSLMILMFALVLCTTVTGTVFNTRLRVLQDVTLERGTKNFNYLQYLIVGTHPRYPLKRSLVRLHPLQVRDCDKIRKAELFLYYAYAHKASFMSESEVPAISRRIVAHQILKSWDESQATSTKRYNGAYWSQQWLNLGSDALATPTSYGVTIVPGITAAGWVKIDVTSAVRNWKNGQPNYGLLLRATNEYTLGRDFRFYSNADRVGSRHPYITVTCQSYRSTGGNGGIVPFPVGGDGIGPAV